jgi:hypothetical protein
VDVEEQLPAINTRYNNWTRPDFSPSEPSRKQLGFRQKRGDVVKNVVMPSDRSMWISAHDRASVFFTRSLALSAKTIAASRKNSGYEEEVIFPRDVQTKELGRTSETLGVGFVGSRHCHVGALAGDFSCRLR